MKTLIIAAILAALSITSCNLGRIEYIKFNPGLCYRIVKQGDGETVSRADIVKMHMKQTYRDSLLSDNTDSLPFYQVHDSASISEAAYTLFGQVTKGDSIIFKALTDSIFKDKMPAFVHKGEWMYTHVYIKDVLPPGYDYQEDLKNEMRLRKMPVPGDEEKPDRPFADNDKK